jgi:alpha-tubulin suppressor-like RCC1 family protein
VVCYEESNLAVSEAGQVFAWGRPPQVADIDDFVWFKPQPPVPTVMEELRHHRMRHVVAEYSHCAAVTEDGTLFTWETRRGIDLDLDKLIPELGYGSFVHDVAVPYRVFDLAGERSPRWRWALVSRWQ